MQKINPVRNLHITAMAILMLCLLAIPQITQAQCTIDNDGDGYYTDCAPFDCDDADFNVNPGVAEICNSLDDNCDGNTDDVVLNPGILPGGSITLCKPNSVELSVDASYDSYQWYKNGNLLAGATGATYTTNAPSYYTVAVTSAGCTGTSAVQPVAVVVGPKANITTPFGTDLCVSGSVKLKGSTGTGYTYQWYMDGLPISGATLRTYTATTVGSYNYTVMSTNGCTETSASVSVTQACRETALVSSVSELTLSPNPADNFFAVNLTTGSVMNTDANILISNVMGETVYAQTESVSNGTLHTLIQTENLVAGIYIVTIQIDGQLYNSRLVIN